jgi:branched-subunit amino acid aminotransferase/4-amino-4-deoxychorismate lyase
MYICQNGEFYKDEEKILTLKNRAFTYGDALFETIHCMGTLPQFIDLHWARLVQGMNLLKMIPGEVISKDILVKHIEKLLNKNRIFKGARIRLEVYRNEGGLYAPSDDSVSWTMESSALEHEKYELNNKGLTADIFGEVLKPVNLLSNLKTANALIYVLAGIFRRENALDDCFILNQYGRLTETGHSNIFILLDDKLISPPLSEGCIAGTMRYTVLELAREAGYTVEERGLLEANLLDAEEIFITNAIQGIQWIGAYKDRRYFNFAARKLISALNQKAFR